jgi:hypothetical protein
MLVPLVFASVALAPLASDADGTEPKELKIIAQRGFADHDDAPPIYFTKLADKPVEPLVIRSAEELAAVSGKARQAKDPVAAKKDPALQKEVQELLAKSLKIDKIDWEKQMVIAASDTAAYRVPPKWEFRSLKANGETLTVEVVSQDGKGYGTYGGTPWVVAVVERFSGKVEFKGLRAK